MFEDAFPQDKQVGGSHYKFFTIQSCEFISKNNLTFFQGNVIKYVTRYENKNGLEDLKKAKWYLDRLIKREERKMKPHDLSLYNSLLENSDDEEYQRPKSKALDE